MPKTIWIDEIVEACDKVGIPIFIKNNMKPLVETPMGILRSKWWSIKNNELILRQEYPVV